MSCKSPHRRYLSSLVGALIALAGCSDDTEDPVRSKAQMLYGTWDLRAARDLGEGDLETEEGKLALVFNALTAEQISSA